MTQPRGQFGYQIVRIIKTSSLGVGSYGAVYRALCDELPCAAKVIHPTLFETHDPGARKIMERFEQECQFLSGVRHPHIVQYLGMSRDPESGLPVLLMELMDSSLTRFLEQSEEALPFHIQVSVCHDVAMALAYLHSNGIIHRDLSSNNVLLIGPGYRAKVTDFGMSKLADASPHMTPMTMCPGTLAYMPPEALDDSPVYTDKLDSFSFGVLKIQIVTQQFPEPSQRFKTMEINDPRFPTGRVKVPVPEIDRRQSHINLIGLAHPLLPVALDCLKDMDRERPSAQELCHRLAAVKETPQYSESVQQATSEGKERQISELQREKAELLEQHTQHVQQQEQHAQQIRDLQQQVQTQSDHLQARVSELTQQIGSLQLQLQEKDHEMEEKDHEMEQRVQELNAQIRSSTAEFQQNLQRREETIQAVRQDNQIEQVQVSETQTTEENDVVIGNIQQPQQTHTATHQPTEPQACYLSMVDRVSPFQLQWRDGGKAPFKGEPGSVAANGNIAYFNPASPGSVDIFDIICYDNGTWSTLPKCGRWNFAMAIISGLLTLIGGLKSGKHGAVHCDSLLSLTGEGQDRKWVERFPPMSTKRSQPAVVCNGKSLVVAGGDGDNYRPLNTVEVMNTETLQWSTASSLPGDNSSCKTGFATMCGDQIYVRCGGGGQWIRSTVTCSLTDLLQSCQSTPQSPQSQSWSLGGRFGTLLSKVLKKREEIKHANVWQENKHANVWREVTKLPYQRSTMISVCGQLLAVGGVDPTEKDSHARKPTDSIHWYNPTTDSWEVISHMPTARCDCLVAVLPSNELMVVGGRIHGAYGDRTDVVEIGTLV